MSEFSEWFLAQHGKRPGGGAKVEELRMAVRAGEEAAALLRAIESWEDRYTSALWAWSAAPRGEA